jgi:hypothetical protein
VVPSPRPSLLLIIEALSQAGKEVTEGRGSAVEPERPNEQGDDPVALPWLDPATHREARHVTVVLGIDELVLIHCLELVLGPTVSGSVCALSQGWNRARTDT